MTNRDDRLGDLNQLVWWGGWNLIWTLLIGIVAGVGPWLLAGPNSSIGLLVSLGIIGGGIWWLVGTVYVNNNYSAVMEEYGRLTERTARKFLDAAAGDTETYVLTYGNGGSILVEPAEDYFSTVLVVGDSSVAIHQGVGIDMEGREPYLKDSTKEIYYDQIASVSYDRPKLQITTSDGGVLEYQSSREPDDALNDITNRVRAYKTA
jgi:hypothetical protein